MEARIRLLSFQISAVALSFLCLKFSLLLFLRNLVFTLAFSVEVDFSEKSSSLHVPCNDYIFDHGQCRIFCSVYCFESREYSHTYSDLLQNNHLIVMPFAYGICMHYAVLLS